MVALKYFWLFVGNTVHKSKCPLPLNSTNSKLDLKLRVLFSLGFISGRKSKVKKKKRYRVGLLYLFSYHASTFPLLSYLTGVLDRWELMQDKAREVKEKSIYVTKTLKYGLLSLWDSIYFSSSKLF